jgi:hypothetical protein
VIQSVVISSRVKKSIQRIPKHVVMKLMAWVEAVENDGLEVMGGEVEFVKVEEVSKHDY